KIAKLHVSEFQGRKNAEPIILPNVELNLVSSRDVPIAILKRKFLKTDSLNEQGVLLKKLNKMLRFEAPGKNLVVLRTPFSPPHHCYGNSRNYFISFIFCHYPDYNSLLFSVFVAERKKTHSDLSFSS
ncbi:hypothetical protein AVEN_173804-1, partial [Araneus ventricosus]